MSEATTRLIDGSKEWHCKMSHAVNYTPGKIRNGTLQAHSMFYVRKHGRAQGKVCTRSAFRVFFTKFMQNASLSYHSVRKYASRQVYCGSQVYTWRVYNSRVNWLGLTAHRQRKYTVSQKQYTWHLIITSANVDRFSKFFHWQIPKETLYNNYRVFHFTLDVLLVATLPSEIQYF